MAALSTALSTATLSPSWKQEVNRRIAVHRSHKAQTSAEPVTSGEGRARFAGAAAQAARRVAERFASAPSYSEMLAREALAAARAAEAASRAAQEAHAAAQSVLSAVSLGDPDWDSQPERGHASEFEATAVAAAPQEVGPALVEARPLFADDLTESREPLLASLPESRVEETAGTGVAEPIFANLIQFPREVIATRKMRPRRIEGPLAAFSSADQLSIFEVDPETVSTEALTVTADGPAAPDWMRTKWSNIEIDELALGHPAEQEEPVAQTPQAGVRKLASLNRRLLAFVVDGTLTVAAFLGFARLIGAIGRMSIGLHAVEFLAAFILLVIAAAYQILFVSLGKTTPGMMYAGISLRTFEGESPARRQRSARLIAMLLSVLPLGLGLVWALFDESHLTWHDRLSGTYLARR